MDAIADAHNNVMVIGDGTCVRAHNSATTLKKRSTPLFRVFAGRIGNENKRTYQSGWTAYPI